MKKIISYILLTAVLILQLSGCGASENAEGSQGTEASGTSKAEELQGAEATGASSASNAEGAQEAEGSGTSEADAAQDTGFALGQGIFVGTEGMLDPSAVSGLAGKDNSLDAFSAVLRVSMQVEKPEGALEGGWRKAFLGASRAYHIKKHYFSPYTASWDEFSFVTAEGETGSESFDWDHQIWGIGSAAGTDHYVTLDLEELEGSDDCRFFFTERDENHGELRVFPLDFMTGSSADVLTNLSSFAVDQSGVAHLIWRTEEGQKYLLVSQEGEILAEYALAGNYSRKLATLYDGRIALVSVAGSSSGGMTLQYLEAGTGSPVTLAAWEKWEKEPYYATLLDEETLLYANREGIYRSRLSGENPELLYRWINHGIIAHGVSAMQVDGEGQIMLIYEDSENSNYICLEPTTEEVPLCEITMAVRFFDEQDYQWVAAEFNKRYPSCHIEVVGYELNDTALLTQLTAGKGPVLVSSSLVNFEEMEELWEPLDMLIEQLGLEEELYPTVLGMGKINGTLYGIVRDFALRTVVTMDPNLKDWDYDTFFQCVQDRPGLEAPFNYYDGESGPYSLIYSFLNHGLDDAYYLVQDTETGAMHFDGDRFRKALELAGKYCTRGEGVLPGSSLLEGKALCNTVSIYKAEHVAAYRIVYGEDADYTGYPTKDGAAHFMECSDMLAIRSSAAKEEKEAAAAFLALCLSYEGQSHLAKELNFELSVRRDVLEEQIAAMGEMSQVNISGFGDIGIGRGLDIELDRKTLLDMIDEAKPAKYLPSELRNIISEEMELYYKGTITEDMMIDHLESRVGLYLGERN